MHRLCSLLGMPQRRFASIHVVGTNGKTSVTRMIAALLESNGVSAGAYTSPHILDWRERIQIRGEPISEEAFTRVLERAEESAAVADRAAGEEGPVTQYELLTAAAFLALAEARVKYAVIEAGLGGRLDATNVIPSQLTVLTSVGLDHTEWLGDTVEEIATEKLAVLRDHSKLITGPLPPAVEPVVESQVERKHATRTSVGGTPPMFPQLNLQLASEAAAGVLHDDAEGYAAIPPPERVVPIPGRAEFVDGDPPLIFDAAHNPDGARALAASLPELAPARKVRRGLRRVEEPREVVCCLAVLEGKDAEGIVAALAPACASFVCTEVPESEMQHSGRPGAKSIPATRLAELCAAAGAEAEAVPDPLAAWSRARELARERDSVALAAGSHYLLSSIWTERPAESS
jgi:dihydrofolate synthase/folylpolyglutamate synthase